MNAILKLIRKVVRKSRNHLILILFITTFLTLVYHAGTAGLFETSEGRYASVARYMVDSGDWLVPHHNGLKHFTKPPLTYWITALGLKLFGINEFGARFFLSVAGAITILGCYFIGALLFSRIEGFIAATILMSSLFFQIQFRGLTTDPFLTMFETFMVLGFLGFLKKEKQSWAFLFWFMSALAMLTKGPPGLLPLLGLIPAGLYLNFHKQLKKLFSMKIGWAIFLFVGLGWYFYLAFKIPGLISYFVIEETLKRVASNTHQRANPFYMYFLLLPVGLFPWTVFFVKSLFIQLKNIKNKNFNQVMLLGWLIFPLIVFSISKSKLAAYVLPLMIPVALIACTEFKRFLSSKKDAAKAWNNQLYALFSIILVFGIAATYWSLTANLKAVNLTNAAGFVGILWLLIAISGLVYVKKGFKAGVISVLFLFSPGFILFSIPNIIGNEEIKPGKYLPSQSVALKRLSTLPKDQKIINIEEMVEGYYFYTGKTIPTWNVSRITAFNPEIASQSVLFGDTALKKYVDSDTLILIRKKDISKVQAALSKELTLVADLGKWQVMNASIRSDFK